MKRAFGKTLATGIVWLTAASTLFASLPHIECRCPDGRLKVFCFASLLAPAADCCESACCEQPAPEASEEPTCCCKPAQPASSHDHASPEGQLKRNGCTKQLVQPDLGGVSYTGATQLKKAELATIDLCATSPSAPLAPVSAIIRAHSDHSPAPPNLVILLQHFLI